MDWNDVRAFLATARSGSTLAAARVLGVSQTTAARRIAALEAALGLALFERRTTGYTLTAAGAELLADADDMERSATSFDEAASALRRDAGGTVRLTCSVITAVTVLAPILRDLHTAHPAIRIELDTSDALRDLAAGEAEVAIRTAERPEGAGLVGRRVAEDQWTVYCSGAYAEAHGRPHRRADLHHHSIIGGGEPGVWRIYREWLAANGLERGVAMHHSSSIGLLAAVRAGAGIAALPCFVADHEPDLVRCLPPLKVVARGIWLLTHERYRGLPRVRTVVDFLAPRLVALARDVEDAGR